MALKLDGTSGIDKSTALIFDVDSTEYARIDSSGNLLVNTTDASTDTAGIKLRSDLDLAAFTKDGGHPLQLNRLTSDGEIVQFRKDGTAVGEIGSKLGDVYIGTGDTGIVFYDDGNAIIPFNTTASYADASINLGDSYNRFNNLFLSGGAYIGGTSSSNKLDDYEEGTWTPQVSIGGIDVTTTGTYCNYVKIGQVVHVHGQLTFASGTNTSYVRFNGLPFSAQNRVYSRGIMVNDYFDYPERYFMYIEGTMAYLRVSGATQSNGSRVLDGNDLKDSSNLQFYISIVYKTAS